MHVCIRHCFVMPSLTVILHLSLSDVDTSYKRSYADMLQSVLIPARSLSRASPRSRSPASAQEGPRRHSSISGCISPFAFSSSTYSFVVMNRMFSSLS